jgi:hypothetical protein
LAIQVGAFLWSEGVEKLSDAVPEPGGDSLGGLAQNRLELGEG